MRRALWSGLAYFAAVFAAGFGLGVLRTLWLLPRLGPVVAVLAELPVILAISWIVCRRLLRGWRPSTREAALMGGSAFALLMLAEAAVSITLAGRSLREHLALYAEAPHLLGLLGQLAFAGFPSLQRRGERS